MRLAPDETTFSPSLRTPGEISGYRLVRRRGRGGYAEVWEAESPCCSRRVALKLVQLSSGLRSGELRALEITREVRHPALVTNFATWQVDNVLVISMELAERSLWDRFLEVEALGLRGIPRPELLDYLGAVAGAIDYLNDHKHSIAGHEGVGIQHRDLKPQNILLVGDRAKVADFGLARVMERAVASHTGPCTLPYAAPEYFRGETSRQSDQYAFAATYCQLRGGRLPFLGSSAQIVFGHLHRDPDLRRLPGPERPIVARALAKRPGDRWPDCRAFVEALRGLGAGEGGSVPDVLPRDQADLAPTAVEPDEPSGRSRDSIDIAFGTDDGLDSGCDRSWGDSSGIDVVFATEPPSFDHEPRAASYPSGIATDRRPDRPSEASCGVGPAVGRSRLARLGQVAAAVSALGLVLLTRGAGSLAARPRPEEPSREMTAARIASPPRRPSAEIPTSAVDVPGLDEAPPLDLSSPVPVVEAKAETDPDPDPSPVLLSPVPTPLPTPPVASRDASPSSAPAPAPVPDPAPAPASVVDVPAEVTLDAGGAATVPVRVTRRDTSKPAYLEFRGLPSGLAAGPSTIREGADAADVVLSSTAATPTGVAEVAVVSTSGTERVEARIRINVRPSPAAAACKRGQADLARGANLQAIDAFDEAIRLDPDSFAAHFHRGAAYFLTGRYHEALADYTDAIRLRPDSVEPYLVRARVHLLLGKTGLALADYSRAIRLRPEARTYLARGSLQNELGAYDRALDDYEMALKIRPDDPSAYYRRGLTRYYMGDHDGAIRDFTEVIRLDPKHSNAYRYRGDAFARLGASAKAGADRDAFERLNRLTRKGGLH